MWDKGLIAYCWCFVLPPIPLTVLALMNPPKLQSQNLNPSKTLISKPQSFQNLNLKTSILPNLNPLKTSISKPQSSPISIIPKPQPPTQNASEAHSRGSSEAYNLWGLRWYSVKDALQLCKYSIQLVLEESAKPFANASPTERNATSRRASPSVQRL